MNTKRICSIVEKYRGRLVRETLYDPKPDWANNVEDRFCVIGACLHDSGVPKEELIQMSNATPEAIWEKYEMLLRAQFDIETAHEVVRLVHVNDEEPDGYYDREASLEDHLLAYLGCEG